ncbi:hypothetical protein ACQ1P1_00930, partial [Ornithobacterium rhinotracheale]
VEIIPTPSPAMILVAAPVADFSTMLKTGLLPSIIFCHVLRAKPNVKGMRPICFNLLTLKFN